MRHRPLALGALGACTLACVGLAAPAAATTSSLTSGASAYAAAAGTGTASLRANLQLSGTLGGLLDVVVDPIVSNDLNPLLSALSSTTTTLVAGALGSASPYNAATTPAELQNSTAPGTFPNETFPSACSGSGGTAQPCFSGASSGVTSALATASVGALQGFVEQVAAGTDSTNPVLGRAQVASANVSVLPALSSIAGATNPLVSTGAVDAKANCPNDGAAGATKPATSPSASLSASTVNLLGGLVQFSVLNGQIASLSVGGTTYGSGSAAGTLAALPTVTVGGATVSQYGSSVQVSIPLTAAQVFSAVGLSSSIVGDLAGYSPTSTVTLRLTVGPNAAVTNTTVSAYGLGIGADLSGALSFNLLNLATATVNLPSGITAANNGNLLDLRLASTTCQSGIKVAGTTPAIPISQV